MHGTKKILFILGIVALFPLTSYAASFGSFGVGGRVNQLPPDLEATIVCSAPYGPFTLRPFNTAVPGPYFIRNTVQSTPSRNGYFLGLYRAIPDLGICTNPETGTPVPAFEVKVYGVSR